MHTDTGIKKLRKKYKNPHTLNCFLVRNMELLKNLYFITHDIPSNAELAFVKKNEFK